MESLTVVEGKFVPCLKLLSVNPRYLNCALPVDVDYTCPTLIVTDSHYQ